MAAEEVYSDYGWDGAAASRPGADPADEFCRLACLTYTGDDGPQRWAAAEPPQHAHIWSASAAARPTDVHDLLAADPGRARSRGGPFGWRPLCYLAYSRVEASQADTLETARHLLAAGADPGEGFLFDGEPYVFSTITGVLGGGEQSQPRHPHWRELARLLLDAGADPNDGQALYNRMFATADDHLELLFEYDLGRPRT